MKADHSFDRKLEAFERLFQGRVGSDKFWIWFVGLFCVIPIIGYIFSWPIRFIVFGIFNVFNIPPGKNGFLLSMPILIISLAAAFLAYLYLWRIYRGRKNLQETHTASE